MDSDPFSYYVFVYKKFVYYFLQICKHVSKPVQNESYVYLWTTLILKKEKMQKILKFGFIVTYCALQLSVSSFWWKVKRPTPPKVICWICTRFIQILFLPIFDLVSFKIFIQLEKVPVAVVYQKLLYIHAHLNTSFTYIL